MRNLIQIYNLSTLISDADAKAATAACATQLTLHVGPSWGILPPVVVFNPSKELPKSGDFMCFVDRDESVPDAAAYHTEESGGREVGFILMEPILSEPGSSALSGPASASGALSHELCEGALDKPVNLWSEASDGYEYPREVCDAVQSSGYNIGKVTVSNFLLPAWFDTMPAKGARFDWLGILKAPFVIDNGGYADRRKVDDGSIEQIGLRLDWKSKAIPKSRRSRRGL